ncbi:hypothetical protein AAG570_012670 [Ranatra chinensis]|uniref:Uncharacterized protein n=1 Tax=Ranatra chinensis TaxID=642074 RepID=A0ABD0YEU2_9HEMI
MEQATMTLEAVAPTTDYTTMAQLAVDIITRLSPTVRADCGIETTKDLACVTRKLKETYGGFRRRAERSAVKLLRMRRADEESLGDFAHRADQALRPVNQRIQAETDTTAVAYEIRLVEKLVSKEDRNLGWKTVERRRDCREGQQENRRIPPPPLQPQSPQKKTNRGQRRGCPKSWTHRRMRHLQHTCPSLDQQGEAYWPKPNPMEWPLLTSAKAASSFSGCIELNSSRRMRPDNGGFTDQKIGYRTGNRQRSPTWGCMVLIDTESISNIIKKKVVRNRGWQSTVKLCTLVGTIVAGPTPLSGELVLSLKGLSGKNKSVIAHVMDWASNEYDAILGTDALRSEGGVSRSGYIGATMVKKIDHIRADNVTQHFEAVFHTESEPLSATGRVRH